MPSFAVVNESKNSNNSDVVFAAATPSSSVLRGESRFPQNTANIFVAAFCLLLIWMILKLVSFWIRGEWDKARSYRQNSIQTSIPTPVPISVIPAAATTTTTTGSTTATTTAATGPSVVTSASSVEDPPPSPPTFTESHQHQQPHHHPALPSFLATAPAPVTTEHDKKIDRLSYQIVQFSRSAEIARLGFLLILAIALVQSVANVNHHAITVLVWVSTALFIGWMVCLGVSDRSIFNLGFSILICK